MPGYGYAAAPKPKIAAWTALIHAYLRGRANSGGSTFWWMRGAASRRPTTRCSKRSSRGRVSYQIVLSKADEVKETELKTRIAEVEAAMTKWPGAFPGILVTSARAGTGLTELRAAIARTKSGARMNSGLEGVIAAETVLSHNDGETGTIWLRGHTIEDLVENHGYEGAVAIIWEGFVGEGLTRAKILSEFGAARERAFARLDEWIGTAAKRPVPEGLRIALAALPEQSTPIEIAATFPVAVAALIRTRAGKAPVKPDASLATTADFLSMMNGTPASANEIRALDCYFTSVCENGLGASGFAGRVAISTRASLVSAIVAAYCTFTGPLHGGAPGPVLDMLDEIEASGDIEGWIEKKLASGGRLMGFGHRIFRVPDVRVPNSARGRRGARQGHQTHCFRRPGGESRVGRAQAPQAQPGSAQHRNERGPAA